MSHSCPGNDCGEENAVGVRCKGENIRKEGNQHVQRFLHSVRARALQGAENPALPQSDRKDNKAKIKKNLIQPWRPLWFKSEMCPHLRVTFRTLGPRLVMAFWELQEALRSEAWLLQEIL